MIVTVGGAVDEGVEAVDPGWQVEAGVELGAPGRVHAFDTAVHLGRPWRQDL